MPKAVPNTCLTARLKDKKTGFDFTFFVLFLNSRIQKETHVAE